MSRPSPYHIDGLLPRNELDEESKKCLERKIVFATGQSITTDIDTDIRPNILVLSRALVYFTRCIDQPVIFWEAVAAATGWSVHICRKISRHLTSARLMYLSQPGHSTRRLRLPSADNEGGMVARVICLSIDKLASMEANSKDTVYDLTNARREYIDFTRQRWASLMAKRHAKVTNVTNRYSILPPAPRVGTVDWIPSNVSTANGQGQRSRSRSPQNFASTSYRSRSPLCSATTKRADDSGLSAVDQFTKVKPPRANPPQQSATGSLGVQGWTTRNDLSAHVNQATGHQHGAGSMFTLPLRPNYASKQQDSLASGAMFGQTSVPIMSRSANSNVAQSVDQLDLQDHCMMDQDIENTASHHPLLEALENAEAQAIRLIASTTTATELSKGLTDVVGHIRSAIATVKKGI